MAARRKKNLRSCPRVVKSLTIRKYRTWSLTFVVLRSKPANSLHARVLQRLFGVTTEEAFSFFRAVKFARALLSSTHANRAFPSRAIAAGFFFKFQKNKNRFFNKKGTNLMACVLRIRTVKSLVAKKERG